MERDIVVTVNGVQKLRRLEVLGISRFPQRVAVRN